MKRNQVDRKEAVFRGVFLMVAVILWVSLDSLAVATIADTMPQPSLQDLENFHAGTVDKRVNPIQNQRDLTEQIKRILVDANNGGRGVPHDLTEAVNWFRNSAEGGCADAQFEMAELYAAGNGVEASPAEAIKWMRMAAEQGLPQAQLYLGKLLRTRFRCGSGQR